MWRTDPLQLLAAVLLDLILGDPRGWPHLARITGFLTIRFEHFISTHLGRTIFSGLIHWLAVCGSVLGAFSIFYISLYEFSPINGWLLGTFVIYQTIAARDLHNHVDKIINRLASNDLTEARQNLAMIVGRDTKNLNVTQINRAGIESVAESLTDGILAPLFWSIIAGPAGALIYRVANTLDSMVGHRNAKYEYMGKVSARIDDVLSWIPARLTVLMFSILRPSLPWRAVAREGRGHASPNAGWGEAAMAYALNVRLGGDNWYQGERVSGPIFNPNGQAPRLLDLQDSLSWMWKVTGLFSAGGIVILLISKYLYGN